MSVLSSPSKKTPVEKVQGVIFGGRGEVVRAVFGVYTESTVLLRRLENAPIPTSPSFSKMISENDYLAVSFSNIDTEKGLNSRLAIF